MNFIHALTSFPIILSVRFVGILNDYKLCKHEVPVVRYVLLSICRLNRAFDSIVCAVINIWAVRSKLTASIMYLTEMAVYCTAAHLPFTNRNMNAAS